jgi:hemerythrin-like domain-containing protein
MNAITLLKQDHKTVKGLFRQFEEAGDKAHKRKGEIAEKTCEELEVHATIEEEIFYPAVMEAVSKEGKDLVREALEEHAVVKKLVEELQSMSAEDEQFEAKYTVLAESVKHHIEEEEGEMMPQAEKKLGTERVTELGEEMAQRKEAFTMSFMGKVKQAVGKLADSMGNGQTRRSPKRAASMPSEAKRGDDRTQGTRRS